MTTRFRTVILRKKEKRVLFGFRAFPFVTLRRQLTLFNVTTVSLVPPVENRARNEDRRERSGKDTDDEDKREIVDHTCAEDVKRDRRKKCRNTREQGA